MTTKTTTRLFRNQCGQDAVLVGYSEQSVSATLDGHRRSAHKGQKSDGPLRQFEGYEGACTIVMSAAPQWDC